MGISGILGFVIGASALFLSVQSIGAGIATPISSTNPVVSVSIGIMFGWEPKVPMEEGIKRMISYQKTKKKYRLPKKCPVCDNPVIQGENEVALRCENPQCFL